MECKVRDSCGTSGTGETRRRLRRGGSSHAPRKASSLKRKSTTPKSQQRLRKQPFQKSARTKTSTK
ncbi:hypothetical protein QYF49_00610 [Fictibacillus sp. CENA-BCM004]|uniref:Uncharacterized protein n=1 Tax=Fictibacillus terranigra TaxID=3058424 RepID=A0ABT8E0Y1_9BACL|nr:hypothetical protein [Fictibacillus sp. CENA-BCM004]MDN4071531.1 hypothetical protein [Fictibacillus sp. CENA-BCM004]